MEIECLLRCARGCAVMHIEEVERLDHSILHHSEIVRFYTLHRIAFGVCHDDIHDDAPNLYRELVCGRLRGLGDLSGPPA